MPSITFDPNRNSWLARATIAGKQKTLGRFKTELEAQQAVDAALREAAVTEAARIKTTWIAVPPGWEKLKHHPYACVVEFGAGINLDALAAHMRDHGYDESEAIVLFRESPKHEARILAGRHRHEAAKMAGVTPSFRILEGKDDAARAYALKDIHRRHLTESQRAMIAAKLANLNVGQKASDKPDSGIPLSQAQAAETMNVSVDTVKQAKKVIANGTPELQEAVGSGAVSVSDAAKVADKPPEVQNQAVADVKSGKSRTASASANGTHKGNGKPHKNGAVVFDDTKVKDAIGKLARLFNERAQKLGQQKSKEWEDIRKNMDLLIASWDRWQLKKEKK